MYADLLVVVEASFSEGVAVVTAVEVVRERGTTDALLAATGVRFIEETLTEGSLEATEAEVVVV